MKKTGGVSTTLPVFFNPIFMKKRILITGGAGFIGSHLCKRLLDEGNEVLCLDNYFTGNKENILPLIQHPYFEVIRHDIMNSFYAEVDEIYHPSIISTILAEPSTRRLWEPSMFWG